ncbi:MAG: acetyl-CoA C-acyltransferase [Calditrichia bacterium]
MISKKRRAVVVDGCRIPFLKSNTGYQDLTSYDMGRMAIESLVKRTELDKSKIDWVIMGSVVSNLATSNVARESALGAGIPSSVPAYTITQACVSGNRAITSGMDLIVNGQADVVIAGGTESLTDIPIRISRPLRDKLMEAQKYKKPLDYLNFVKGLHPKDLLPETPSISEYSTHRTMGEDCDRMAARIGVNREEQDKFALRSHLSAARARKEGILAKEIEPALIPPNFEPITEDNGIRGDTSMEKLKDLHPAFIKPYGTLTAGNSSFLTDGAAAVLLMSEEAAKALGYTPKAAIIDYAFTAQDPFEELLLGPAYAIPKVLDRAGMELGDIDVFELHEAFAAQILANLICLDSDQFAKENLGRDKKVGEIPMEKLNTWGGSLSIGHPFGATGGRLVTTAANRLIAEDGKLAVVASCAAGAIGNAIILERLS